MFKRKVKEAVGAGLTAAGSAVASYRAFTNDDPAFAWISLVAAVMAVVLTMMLTYDAIEERRDAS